MSLLGYRPIRIALVIFLLLSHAVLKAEAADYFPLQVGNRWTYSPSYGDKGDRIDRVVGTESVNSTITYIWNRQEAPDDNYHEKRWLAKDGSYLKVYKIWGTEGPITTPIVISPPWNMLKLNPVVGDTWEFAIDIASIHYKATYYVRSTTDSVTVAAGSFNNCIRVQELSEVTESGATEYEYDETIYAPDVGPIIYRDYTENWDSVTFSQELVNYSLSKTPLTGILPLLLLDEEPVEPSADYWVDSSTGNNANPGTKSKPFKTISYALSVAGENKTIKINPGTYDEVLGETFPLVLQSGQILIGDEANKGDGTTPTLIIGHGDTGFGSDSATIIGAEGTGISGFKIGENTYIVSHFAVWVNGINLKVSENTFKTSTYGGVRIRNNGTGLIEKNVFNTDSYGVISSSFGVLTIQNNNFTSPPLPIVIGNSGANTVIRDNTITGDGTGGIQVESGNPLLQNNTFSKTTGYTYGAIRTDGSDAEPTVRGNVFNCTKAVLITDGNPDLGTASDNGNNNFSSVTGASVTHEGSATVYAIGNTWPNTPPVCWADIVVTNSGSVVWGSPSLQCP